MKSTSMFSAAIACLALSASAAIAQTMEQPASYEEPVASPRPMVALASWLGVGGGAACTDPACSDPACTTAAPSCGDVLGYGPASAYCGETCGPGCRSLDMWGNVEFLLWWAKGTSLPPLVGTSDDSATIRDDASVVGRNSFRSLFGGGLEGSEVQTGGRVTLGLWLDPQHTVGWGGRFMALTGDDSNFAATSTGDQGTQILGRPFFNALSNDEDALLIAYFDEVQGDPIAGGSVNASFSNSFLSAETFFRIMMNYDGRKRTDLIAGYHFMRIDDGVHVESTTVSRDPLSIVPVGTQFDITDDFRAKNQFHGGMMGLMSTMQNGQWSIDSTFKMSVGNMRQQLELFGETQIDGVVQPGGGLLVQPTNATPAVTQRDKLCFIPELSLALAYHPTETLSFSVGYNIIWVSDMITSGDQIDRRVNLSQVSGPLVGPALPEPRFNDSDYWLQGINFTMNYDF